ncbi:uncharacterized protein LOC129762562 [Toxorhynchites rutilus septentrionalis]|uniref:uncharacterized protein LOC129762562 n=1 Tax=Toxorhynchites rutilus septentrionalis TaxID=329112 RepID=UPI002478DDBE|nr:uncharacterized protein LOC129762562 [Toxorhynchites rutilus septentrionalis]
MGGCRCTFRNCENSTASRPGMHFFHYPIRDWPRLEKWAAFANKVAFKELPLAKLKNKVVCEEHFKNSMFMNYLKESLTKTAVPTLDVLAGERVLDLETNAAVPREEWIVPEKESKEPEPVLVSLDSDNTRMQIKFLDEDEPVQEQKPVRNNNTVILNKEPEFVAVNAPSTAILRKVVIKRKNPPSNGEVPSGSKMQILSIEKLPKKATIVETVSEETPALATPSSSTDITINKPPLIIQPEPVVIPQPSAPVIDPALMEKLTQNSNEIAELKNLVVEALNKPPIEPKVITVPVPTPVVSPAECLSLKLEKGLPMNKVQLFNGIKRYLNPTMVALLRMEMFGGSAERQWKTDEKSLAVELLSLGENVYDHFCDEFRFRLPQKRDVQKWKDEELNDDDAS